jgi:signal transduction histidine kinase
MCADDQRKLFKDFTTLKSNAHLNPNGVGLGLSICKKITSQLNGDIWVESKLG